MGTYLQVLNFHLILTLATTKHCENCNYFLKGTKKMET